MHPVTHVHQPLDTIRDFSNDHPREYATGTKRYNRVDIFKAIPKKMEIISIKNTQIAGNEKAFMGYIRELAYKYNEGTPIANTPSTPDFLRGTRLAGKKVLLIPLQENGIPAEILSLLTKWALRLKLRPHECARTDGSPHGTSNVRHMG